jgi:hypothetical protein
MGKLWLNLTKLIGAWIVALAFKVHPILGAIMLMAYLGAAPEMKPEQVLTRILHGKCACDECQEIRRAVLMGRSE